MNTTHIGWATGATLLAILALSASCQKRQEEESKLPVGVIALDARFDVTGQPYAFVLESMAPPTGVPGIMAKDCGQCHKTIYEEWKASTHAAALRDPQFQAELAKPGQPSWLCLNCHIPLADQRQELIEGLTSGDVLKPVTRPNPSYREALRDEAITCAVCHLRKNANGVTEVVGVYGSKFAPHPVRRDPEGLRSICMRCHNPQGEALTPNLFCWFTTKAETAVNKGTGECVDCHMPETERLIADTFAGLPKRKVRMHHWVGGGVPKEADAYPGLLARGYRSGLTVRDLEVELHEGRIDGRVTVGASATGHDLPTADPERHILIVAKLRAPDGILVDKTSLRIGQDYQWNPAKKVGDNRLRDGEKRPWVFKLDPKGEASSLEIVAYHVRLTTKNLEHMQGTTVSTRWVKDAPERVRAMGEHYPAATVIYREQRDLTTGTTTIASPEQLIALSRAELRVPAADRDY